MDDLPVDARSPWPLWQLIDSAFPIGGFAHSGGLEAAAQLGEIGSAEALGDFIGLSLQQAARLGGPFVAATAREPSKYAEFDALHDAMLTSTVARNASLAQGQALLSTATLVWTDARLAQARSVMKEGGWRGHWPVAFGLIGATLNLTLMQVVDAFFFCHLRGLLSAAVRLGLAGSRQAQRLQADLGTKRASLIHLAMTTPIEQACQIAPVLELLQSQHERLYSRLFVS